MRVGRGIVLPVVVNIIGSSVVAVTTLRDESVLLGETEVSMEVTSLTVANTYDDTRASKDGGRLVAPDSVPMVGTWSLEYVVVRVKWRGTPSLDTTPASDDIIIDEAKVKLFEELGRG